MDKFTKTLGPDGYHLKEFDAEGNEIRYNEHGIRIPASKGPQALSAEEGKVKQGKVRQGKDNQ